MRHYSGILLVTHENSVLLQQRDIKTGIANSGLITTFGGTADKNESPIQCAFRELVEETNLRPRIDELKHFITLTKTEVDGSETEVNIFTLIIDNKVELEIFEGQGFIEIFPSGALDSMNLSQTAKKVVQSFFKVNNALEEATKL